MPTDINEFRMKRKGELMFMTCECGSQDWAIVAVHGGDKPVISNVVCTGCGADSTVLMGKVEV